MEEAGAPEGEVSPRVAWWAPAPPKFTAESWEWSEDEEEWLPAKGKELRTGKVKEKAAGGSPTGSTPGKEGGSRQRAPPVG